MKMAEEIRFIPILVLVAIMAPGCLRADAPRKPSTEKGAASEIERAAEGPVESPSRRASNIRPEGAAKFMERRQAMVDNQIRARGIRDKRVLETLSRVARHQFVPLYLHDNAYDDGPLPIGHGQTISQPYIVALMTELVQPKPGDRALDIGTGCGYQAAVLAELVGQVYSIEIVPSLADEARERLRGLGYQNIQVRRGDGYQGWVEHAPFQVIVVAAAPDHVPPALVQQLAPGGRMVIPVGRYYQELLLIEKLPDGEVRESTVAPVAFVPMTGEAERR